jgi:hypothetical protein
MSYVMTLDGARFASPEETELFVSERCFGCGLSGLGDARSDLKSVLSVVVGSAKAEATIAGFEEMVRRKAMEGTNAALDQKTPGILAKVETEVSKIAKPLFYGAMAVGGLGLLFALVANKKCKR